MATAEAAVPLPAPSRGSWRLAWRRLRGEKLAVVSIAALAVILFASFVGAPRTIQCR